jgi:hypothetical protein
VLHRPRLTRFIDADLRAELLDQLVSGTLWFEPAIAVADCRDPIDNEYPELALAAQAATIVSSGQDVVAPAPVAWDLDPATGGLPGARGATGSVIRMSRASTIVRPMGVRRLAA